MASDKGKYKFLHTMIRVLDLDKSLEFYTKHFGMTELRRRDVEGGRYTVCFVGYGDEKENTVIELTHNWDQTEPYELGSAFGHLAIAVPDAYKVCEELEKDGVDIPRPAGPLKHSGPDGPVIAFVKDPDGYMIELIQRPNM